MADRSRSRRPKGVARQDFFLDGYPLRKSRPIWAAALLLLLAACGSGSDGGSPTQEPPPGQEPVEAVATAVGDALEPAVTQSIGPAGGVLESADGALRIEVPAGALADEQIVSIQPISNHAHGKIGGAFRLGPEGVSFAVPVRLSFRFTPEQILGTAAPLLRVVSQDRDGFWELHEDLQLDAEAKTVSVDIQHFSDWSLMSGVQLSPQSATVKPGETVSLSVVVCERVQPDDLLTPLIAQCQPSTVIRNLARNWSVNGSSGGNASVGTVSVQEDRAALYTAPATAPQSNPVAVSAEYAELQGELVMLVANIRVQSGLCTPASPGAPCLFNLAEFNGQALPYEGLPRETWENPETITSGRLSLSDFDGDGAGTWSLRHVWVESKPSGDLEQFMQLAGDFTSESMGRLNFTVLGGGAFTGTLQQNTVTIEDYPLTTKNVSVPARLQFRDN